MADDFSRFLKDRREQLGLTVNRFAELVGRSPSTVRSWERGRSRPGDPKVISAVAAVLDLAEDDVTALVRGREVEAPRAPVARSVAPETPPALGTRAPSYVETMAETSRSSRAIPTLPRPPRGRVISRADHGVRYQLRALATITAIVILLVVLQWTLGEFRDALSDLRLSMFGP